MTTHLATPPTTLFDLVSQLQARGANDREVVAVVRDLFETGRVELVEHIESDSEQHPLAHRTH